jgi:hypothetical protein
VSVFDIWLIAIILCAIGFTAWVAYNVGQGTTSREYEAALATERARARRLQRDLANAYEELQIARRGRSS